MNYAIGIDLGGSSIKCVAVTDGGRVLTKTRLDFDADSDWAGRIREGVRQIESAQKKSAAWIGLSAPGLAAKNGRSIAHMPGRLAGLEGLDWTKFLKAKKTVPVLNDAHAALLGEAWLGAAKNFENAILLTLGTGVGGAIVLEGKLWRGTIGRAGHLGHVCLDITGAPDICGVPGSLEMAMGNATVAARSGGRFQSTHALISAHRRGNKVASKIWLTAVRGLACAVASFINVLDPEVVIIGGGIARAGHALFRPLRKFLDEMEWRPGGHRARILPAQLGEFAGAIGAAANAIRRGRRRF